MHRSLSQLVTLLSVLACGSAPAAAAGLTVEGDAGIVFDANVGRAQRGVDREGDTVVGAGVRVGRPWRAGAGFLLLDATVRREQPLDLTDLARTTLTGRAAWRTGLPALGPGGFLEAGIEAAHARHDDSDLRDGTTLAPGLVAGRRFGDRVTGRAGYRFERRRGGSAGVFDTDQHRLFLDADLRWTPVLTLYGTAEWRTGEVVSTATASPAILAVARAAAIDDALSGPGRRRVAYRLEGTGAVAEAGANVAVSPAVALDASVLYHDTQARAGNAYHGVIGQVSVLWRWR